MADSFVLSINEEVELEAILARGSLIFEVTPVSSSISALLDFLPMAPKTYVCLTSDQVASITGILWRQGSYNVTEVAYLRQLERLNFRRNEYITLHFKGGRSSRFTMVDSHSCAKALQERMKAIGKVGKTSLTPRKATIAAAARTLFTRAKEYEQEFNQHPTHAVVLKMVNTLREATELMSEVSSEGDVEQAHSYQEIMEYFQGLLRRPDVTKILDNSGKTDGDQVPTEVAQNETISETTAEALPPSSSFSSSLSAVVSKPRSLTEEAAQVVTPSSSLPSKEATTVDPEKLLADIARSSKKLAQEHGNLAEHGSHSHTEEEEAVDLRCGEDGADDEEEDNEFELDIMLGSLQDELNAITGDKNSRGNDDS